jgi:hypothetical protein
MKNRPKHSNKIPIAEFVTWMLIAAFSMGGGLGYIYMRDRKVLRVHSESVQQQVARLSAIEQNLKELAVYVQLQKQQVAENGRAVEELGKERLRLQTLTQTDKATVEALFAVQDEKNRKNLWVERYISFGAGVISSLIATTLWYFVSGMRSAIGKPWRRRLNCWGEAKHKLQSIMLWNLCLRQPSGGKRPGPWPTLPE